MTTQLQTDSTALIEIYTKIAERFLPAIRNRLQTDPLYKLVQGLGFKFEIDQVMKEEITKFVNTEPLLADINASMMAADLAEYMKKTNVHL